MTKKLVLGSVVACAVLSLPACSTIANGSNQKITFQTADASGPVEGATCNITGGSDGAVNEKITTPTSIKIPRSKKALNITCNKQGYPEGTKKVFGKIEGTTAGNIVAGGVIGIGVDALTGAMYKYPKTITIMLENAKTNS